ncbi:MAG: alpha/beta hydrolase [Fimbriimonadaceae bacterium]|nr:alpha/beta hydrolase [Fimbriimonadaceae bacterium]
MNPDAICTARLVVLAIALLVAACAAPEVSPHRQCAPRGDFTDCRVVENAFDDFNDAFSEDVVMIPNPSRAGGQLEVTVFRRDKDRAKTNQPLVVINHGAAGLPDPHQQPRNRPIETAKYFLQRGYLVVAPMRTGFGNSTGRVRSNCDHFDYAMRYESDIETTVAHFVANYGANPGNVVVTGQSNGGVVSLGYAAKANRAQLVVNFAGGIDARQCDWVKVLIASGAKFGTGAKLPTLWIYTRTDRTFPPDVSLAFYRAYRSNGGKGEFYMYDEGGHGFSNTKLGRLNYAGILDEKLKAMGLAYLKN